MNVEEEVVEEDMAGADADVAEEVAVVEQKEAIQINILFGCQMEKFWIVTPHTTSHLMNGR